jgi:hypothetical protein
MQTLELFIISLHQHLNSLDFLPTLLFFCVLTITCGWSVFSDRMKLALYFAGGVVFFGGFFEQIINKFLFPDLYCYVPLVLGSITAGLLELGAILAANRIMIIGIFFSGAILPLFLLAYLGFFEIAKISVMLPLITMAVLAICSGVAMLKITHTKPFQLIASAAGGALSIAYLTELPYELANWKLLDIDRINAINHIMQNNRFLSAAGLAISGAIVQALIHLAIRRCLRQKAGIDKMPTVPAIP